MGQVYRATDTHLKRTVAIKVLPEAMARDGERFSALPAGSGSARPGSTTREIAQIYGLEKSDAAIALVMELVEGLTLAEWIAKGTRLEPPACRCLASDSPAPSTCPRERSARASSIRWRPPPGHRGRIRQPIGDAGPTWRRATPTSAKRRLAWAGAGLLVGTVLTGGVVLRLQPNPPPGPHHAIRYHPADGTRVLLLTVLLALVRRHRDLARRLGRRIRGGEPFRRWIVDSGPTP